jgi:hypothetical protein
MDEMTASEALYGFMAWLTGRKERVAFSSSDAAGKAADLVAEFCKANTLREPGEKWTERLTMPACENEIFKQVHAAATAGTTRYVELSYPLQEQPAYVTISLSHVRAADDVRISYDFERDGWIIEQASIFEWDGDDQVCDADWAEVAFAKAWARKQQAPAKP